ncbi:MAG TPA: GAF domain-containing protein [Gaiellaceae bacterium]|nr:GAF domain-containing protein [Gaiellaceae bacterium]
MSRETQAIVFNAVPLLVLAAAYLVVTAALVPALWRERARTRRVELALTVTFPAIAAAAAVWGAVVVRDERALGGHLWISFGGSLVALLPAVLGLLSLGETRLAATAPARARRAEALGTLRDVQLQAASRISIAFARTDDVEEISRILLDELGGLFELDFGGLALVGEGGREARGVLARAHGEDVAWWRDVRVDLEHEPSGIASAYFEAAPVSVYDVASSPKVSRRLAENVGAKSAVYVPLVTREHVLGVLSLATVESPRAFTPEELALMLALASEAATALDRSRSAAALAQALEREQLVASISRKLRSELDLGDVLDVLVSETAKAVSVDRCFVRIDRGETHELLLAEWRAPDVEAIREPLRLPVANLAARERRTVVVEDAAADPLLADGSLGGRDALLSAGIRSALATPIVVVDETVGAFVLHRRTPGPWSSSEVALAEAVAHEAALAIRVARLLEQSRRRIADQSALLRAAEVLTGDLDLANVLQRLADQVAELLDADAADCYLYDREQGTLRCAAVYGLPDDLVGYEFSADHGAAAAAMQAGKAVIAAEYSEVERPVPNDAYAEFAHAVVAPMRWGDETRGVLGVGRRPGGHDFDHSDASVLEAFANLASLALRNAETFAQSARRARVQRGFYRIASVLGQSLSRAATLDAVAQAAAEAFGGSSAAVLVPAGARLTLAGSYELSERLSAAVDVEVAEQTPLGRAAADGRVLAAPMLDGDERFSARWRTLAAGAGVTSLLSVPLESPRHEAGGVVLVLFAEERMFTDDDLELARHLADAARGALERSELFEAERTSRTLAQQLARTGSLLATELDPAGVLEEVVQQGPALLGADACAIRVLEGDQLVVSAAEGEGAEEAVGTHSPAGAWLSGDVVQARAPVAVVDASGDRRFRELDPMLAAGHCSFLGVPLVGPEGALHGVLAIYGRQPREWRDEEVEALRALAANTSAALSNAELYQRVAIEKERSDAILGNIADAIVAVDRDGKVVLWNTAAHAITGVPPEEAVGRTTTQVLQRTLETPGDTPERERLVSIHRGGEEVWLSLTEAVMRDPAGEIAGRIFAFRDISSDRLVEQMKSEFVSAVSHELRTPLTSIYGFAETLLREDVLFGETERRTFLSYIASESQRLTGIVDALLNVARLDTGDLHVNLAPTDVKRLLEDAVAGVRDTNGHRFVLQLPDEPVAAAADPEKLRQVFSILLDNAIKYSPEGGTVTVFAERQGDAVELRVVDEGPGIPATEHERIFRKFYRGAENGRSGGTGLGLFIARGLVTAMGGRISLVSAEGEGSTFAVELPVAEEAALAEAEGRV